MAGISITRGPSVAEKRAGSEHRSNYPSFCAVQPAVGGEPLNVVHLYARLEGVVERDAGAQPLWNFLSRGVKRRKHKK